MASRSPAEEAQPKARLSLLVRGRASELVERAVVQKLGREVRRALEAAGEGAAEMTLSLVDDEEIHALNRDWRYKDRPTDVLSFSMREGEGGALHPELLGDVVISVETAARQAEAAGRPLADELLHLAVHGLVHLCGYDHATLEEERVMFGWEAELRAMARAPASKRRLVPRPPLVVPASAAAAPKGRRSRAPSRRG